MTEASSPTGVDRRVDAIVPLPECSDDNTDQGVTLSPVAVVAQDARTQQDPAVDVARWGQLAERAAVHLGATGELGVTFIDVDEMAELNASFMGVDGPTDVLSFPVDEAPLDSDDSNPASGLGDGPPRLLGDIVVCPTVAVAAAQTHAGTVDDEFALLVVHGVLHLLGYDHANHEDTASMRAQEMKILTTYHWGGPAPAGFRHDHHDASGHDASGHDVYGDNS